MQVAHSHQFMSWEFTSNMHNYGLTLSLGTIGVYEDAALVELFMERMQTEFLNREFWTTIVGLSMAIIVYFETFNVTDRCHSSLAI
jgi:hypothetical protein